MSGRKPRYITTYARARAGAVLFWGKPLKKVKRFEAWDMAEIWLRKYPGNGLFCAICEEFVMKLGRRVEKICNTMGYCGWRPDDTDRDGWMILSSSRFRDCWWCGGRCFDDFKLTDIVDHNAQFDDVRVRCSLIKTIQVCPTTSKRDVRGYPFWWMSNEDATSSILHVIVILLGDINNSFRELICSSPTFPPFYQTE